jgi:phosphoglycerol transferase MdoB-like AlkP superfamily enzyme
MLKKTPNYINYIAIQVLCLLSFTILNRIAFYFFFNQVNLAPTNLVTKAFLLGIRFDLKLAVITIFPIAILIFIFNTKFLTRPIFKKINSIYLTLAYLVITLFYLFDFGYYDYLSTRLDATSLRFFNDFKISSQVLIESYPVFKGLLILLLFLFAIYKLTNFIYLKFSSTEEIYNKKEKAFYIIVPFLLLSFGIFNSLTHYPLRWSQAFFSKNVAVNQYALNPVLYFFDSFSFRSTGFDLEKTKEYYPVIADFLDLSKDTMLFERKVVFENPHPKKPNVVIVMMESVGVAPMSYYGNPINSTPKMDSLVKESVHFTNFFVHKAGTAGSVFASITGLPDVDRIKTASRNPLIQDQRIIFDQFEGYEKLYFLGGSANWANIRGLFQSNIKNLKIFEEGSYDTENRSDVWGIDDYELFKESDKELRKLNDSGKPFITYIQTSSNHMPFTVPVQKESYRPLEDDEINPELLKESGFKSVAQLNALRYLDFNIDIFLKRAKKSGYYDNTIFMFFGDHNTAMNPFNFLEKNDYALSLSVHHVPFFIHAPKFLEPKIVTKNGALIDLFPTAAGVAKQNYTNYTLGVDLLDSTRTKTIAFLDKKIAGEPAVELLMGDYIYSRTMITNKNWLYSLKKNRLIDIKDKHPNITKEMDSLTLAYYYSTTYLYYNNKKK